MRLLITICFILLLAGCGPETIKPSQTVSRQKDISQLLDKGEFRQAAEEALQQAQLHPDQAVHYQQRAVSIYLRAGDIAAATAVLKNIKTTNTADLFYNRLLTAEIAQQANNPLKVLNALNMTPPAGTSKDLLIRYYQSRNQAFMQRNDLIDAVRTRISMAAYLTGNDAHRQNTRQIWSVLNQLSLASLQRYRLNSTPLLAGWLDLAIIYKTKFFKPDQLELAVSLWKEQHPQHPANNTITSDILLASTENYIRPAHIALCLPLSGLYEWAAQAIRDGFLAAWFTSTDYKPVISIYDCDALNVDKVYMKAIRDGADFVVGPLEKSAIANLLANNEIKVTTLALNQIDTPLTENAAAENGSLPRLIQFGLFPEDEARQAADRMRDEGYKRALAITPNNNQGQRLFAAFRSAWNDAGGVIMDHIKYPEKTEEYKTWVKSLLNVNASEKRSANLRNRLGRHIESVTWLRNDADAIFMAASPISGRRIVPEFRFYQTGLPIYSTSDIFTGIINPQLDKDMDGVIFNQIPWILDPAKQGSFLQQSINKLWSAQKSAYRKFYALGIDAYQLIPHLAQMNTRDHLYFPGETGELHLSKDGRIQRKLMWAKFSQGIPVLLKNN